MSILSLNKKLNKTQLDLNKTQKSLIDIEQNSFEQLSGGKNKPIIVFGTKTDINLTKKNTDFPIIFVQNLGSTFLKNVEVWVENPYKNKMFKDSEHYSKSFDYFNDSSLDDTVLIYKNLSTLPPDSKRILYDSQLPYYNWFMNYSVYVLWSNGNYKVNIAARYYEDKVYIKFVEYRINGREIEDQYEFLGFKKVKMSNDYKVCKSIIYKSRVYNIYWNEKNRSIFIKRPNSVYPVLQNIYTNIVTV